MQTNRIVIVGATSGIAQHCARLWAQSQPIDLILVGRNPERLEAVAADLLVRNPQAEVRVVTTDFLDPAAIQTSVDAIFDKGAIDIALIAHGSLPDQSECQAKLTQCQSALELNGISPALFAEAIAGHMAKLDHGTLAVIGSVAGDRGRKSNYVYGSAKGLLTRYVQGLQHRLAASAVKIVLIKPGPTDTPMTAQIKATGARLAPVEEVARSIVKAIAKGKAVAYVPGKWALIMWVIRHLPAFVFNRLDI